MTHGENAIGEVVETIVVPLRHVGGGDNRSRLPGYAHAGDAGCDLRSRIACSVPPRGRATVPTGVALAIPDGWAGLVLPRSGLASRSGVGLLNAPGLIDSGFRGEIQVVLVNHDENTFDIDPGDRIAQLVFVRHAIARFAVVEDLPKSERGGNGFGSSGVN